MNLWPQCEAPGRRIGYARVSTPDQRLDLQLSALKSAACDQVFTDHGVSGAKATRPGLDKALRQLRRDDVLIVFKLDRLGRSVLHLSDLLTRFEREGIHFWSLSEGINTLTPGGKLIYHIFAATAEFQRDLIVENTLHGLRAARERGKRIGRPHALDDAVIVGAHGRIMQEGISISHMAAQLNVCHATLTRGFKRLGLKIA